MTSRRLGFLLALWCSAFAAAHAAWALGWRAGVPDSMAPIAERPAFLLYDVVAGVAILAAGGVALALTHGGPLAPATRARLLVVTTAAAVLALLRGVPALALDLTDGPSWGVGPVADTWFVVAGATGLLLTHRLRSEQRAPRGLVIPL